MLLPYVSTPSSTCARGTAHAQRHRDRSTDRSTQSRGRIVLSFDESWGMLMKSLLIRLVFFGLIVVAAWRRLRRMIHRRDARASTARALTPPFGRRTISSALSTAAGSRGRPFPPIARFTARSSHFATRARRPCARSSRRRPPSSDASRRVGNSQDRRPLRELHGRSAGRAARDETDRSRSRPRSTQSPTRPALVRTMAALEREGVTGLFGMLVTSDAKQSDRHDRLS